MSKKRYFFINKQKIACHIGAGFENEHIIYLPKIANRIHETQLIYENIKYKCENQNFFCNKIKSKTYILAKYKSIVLRLIIFIAYFRIKYIYIYGANSY